MPDPLAEFMAETERRLRALETAPRTPFTSVEGGQTRWLDDNGREAVVIGVDGNGTAFIRINNADGSAPAFEVSGGVGGFPLAASAWQPSYWPGIVSQDSTGRQQTTATVAAYSIYAVTLSLTTPKVRVQMSPECLGSVTEGRFRFWASVADGDPRFNAHTAASIGDVTFDATYPNVQTLTLDIPSSILPDPAEDVVGTLITLSMLCWISAGTGSIAVAPPPPAHCVPV